MTPLAAALQDEIRRSGPITVARYMDAALNDPTCGYYRTRDPLGAAGDFVTAPEISQMFGEMAGAWLAYVWQQMGGPNPIVLAECGPGRGTLMADALRATRRVPGLHGALRLHLVETSPVLRRTQAARLAAFSPTWHDGIATLPPGPLLVVANEFFDALPIRQYVRATDGWRERLVDMADDKDSGGFRFAVGPVSDLPGFADAPVGTIREDAPAGRAVMQDLAARIARHGGAALIVDYGPAASTPGDSLQAMRAHGRHDPLRDPGLADLTAHVDFAGLAATARAAGAAVHGPVEQGVFLRALGIETRADTLRTAAPDQSGAIGLALKRLIAPTDMGTLFKVLAVLGPRQPAPPGFVDAF